MTVREAKEADRFAMVRMGQDFLTEYALDLPYEPAYMEATALAHISNPSRLALILEVENGRHGMLLASCGLSHLAPILVADITVWWIDPCHRRHYRELLRAYEDWAAEQRANLTCIHAIRGAEGLHERRGYKAVDTTLARGVI